MASDGEAHSYEKMWAKLIKMGTLSWNDIVDGYRDEVNVYDFRSSRYYYLYDRDAEHARHAERDVYGCWWRFLSANPEEYPPSQDGDDIERIVLYLKFGHLGSLFESWWNSTGSAAFSESKPEPFIRLVDPPNFKGGDQVPDHITVRIPTSMRQERIFRQLRVLLEAVKPGDQFRRFQRSTAKQTLHPRERYYPEHYDNLLEVWSTRRDHPDEEWWRLGVRLKIEGDQKIEADDPPNVIEDKHRELSARVRRLHRQAERMMWHAVRGRFPCDEPIPNEEA